ncbi:ABC transporter ATP-binding protein [Bradyrhizobium sp. 1]|uniref:ABC transporter ATP-binding protein n=1 Tax=Bradyrhizobium sp. 1 TaxID=241591 RepID=UPI001FFA9727|nr:ABC transporter ATP-binding protein [Bradyrhizobium sp. 1]MCK1394438.1 ABC transporter ATP-binding protein [Bradyrhizobium sp. 1]
MILSVEALTKNFAGLVAVNALSIQVRRNSITALIGPNGAGKTTALNLITGVLRPTAGRVLLKGADITGRSPHSIASNGMTRTYQNLQMFEGMTVLETVMVGAHRVGRSTWLAALLRAPSVVAEEKDLRNRAMAALDRAGVPASYSGRVAAELPYGWQRRVEIARAIASGVDMLLLDEPAAGLNNQESETMAQLICELREGGTTVLLVEHDMNLVMGISDQVIVMNFGQLLSQGTPDQVQNDPAVVEAYLGKGAEAADAVA